MTFRVIHGDVSEVLPTLDALSFDAVLCDPPYGLNFMGKSWDHGVPGEEVWRLVSAALKPGAPLLAFGGTRTYHRLACAIEDAGFDVRDALCWLYGTGFPKSLDISKAIDKAAGAERVPHLVPTKPGNKPEQAGAISCGASGMTDVSSPVTEPAIRWQGYGTALKPAWEPVILAMKPTDGTFAANALAHGVAGLAIDACRIGTETTTTHSRGNTTAFAKRPGEKRAEDGGRVTPQNRSEFVGAEHLGRWPANVLLSHHEDCREAATIQSGFDHSTNGTTREVRPGWECHPECPVRMLDEQSGERKSGSRKPGDFGMMGFSGNGVKPMPEVQGDSGGASRFFYCAKASRGEREAGLREAGLREAKRGDVTGRKEGSAGANHARAGITARGAIWNTHPTVKPLALCEYIARLILPPKRDTPRRLLVPFSGSGSEMIGALLAGWDEVVGIEMEPEYVEIAEARLRYWSGAGPLYPLEPSSAPRRALSAEGQPSLFGDL